MSGSPSVTAGVVFGVTRRDRRRRGRDLSLATRIGPSQDTLVSSWMQGALDSEISRASLVWALCVEIRFPDFDKEGGSQRTVTRAIQKSKKHLFLNRLLIPLLNPGGHFKNLKIVNVSNFDVVKVKMWAPDLPT